MRRKIGVMKRKLICLFTALTITNAAMGLTVYAAWQQEGSQWKYANEAGEYSKDKWELVNHRWYHFDGNGIMQTGWFEESGLRYYLEPENGHMLTGDHVIDGKDCCFALDGHLVEEKPVHVDGLEDDILQSAYIDYANNSQDTQVLLDMLNQERCNAGVSPLILDETLCIAATYRCIEMFKYDYFSHYHNGEARLDIVYNKLAGTPVSSTSIGENIHRSRMTSGRFCDYEPHSVTISDAHKGLVNSESHYQGMISPNATKVGLGIYMSPEENKFYYTQIFYLQ